MITADLKIAHFKQFPPINGKAGELFFAIHLPNGKSLLYFHHYCINSIYTL